jgi:tetratricopeptide (TPR) repeat protein
MSERGDPASHLTPMKPFIQITGILIAIIYASIIAWLYVRRPQSFAELKTQASVQANTYHVNQENFDEAIKEFDGGDYNSAIGQFALADPAQKDPASQYYTAYSYYILGRGRIFNDQDMFDKAVLAVNRCLEDSPNHIFEIDRAGLEIKNADSLRQKLTEGLKHTTPSLNPFNWFDKK